MLSFAPGSHNKAPADRPKPETDKPKEVEPEVEIV